MATKIRLARAGSKKRPFYHIVAADVRAPRDGRYIEKLGTFNPLLPKDVERVALKKERVEYWLSKGALPTDRVLRLLDEQGIMKREPRNNPKKALPGKKALERIEEKKAKAEGAAQAAIDAEEEAKAAAIAAKEAEAAAKAEAEAAPAEEAEATPEAEPAPAEETAPTEEAEPAPAEEASNDEATPFVDNVVLLDGVGDKTAETMIAEGVSKLTQILEMSDEDLAAFAEKIGAAGKHESQEWKIQAQEMKDGKPPRAKVDQELAKKLAAG